MEFVMLSALMMKHYVFDYFLQLKYHFQDKHIYGAPGGIQHASLHGLGSFIVLWPMTGWATAVLLGAFDATLHYHIDYIKSSSLAKANPPLTPNEQQYWIMHGIDQMAHALTYILMVWLVANLL